LPRRKLAYPSNADIKEAILATLSKNPLVSPDDFPRLVLAELEARKFYTGLVTIKRIWRIYEKMVRKGEIFDILQVVIKDYEGRHKYHQGSSFRVKRRSDG